MNPWASEYSWAFLGVMPDPINTGILIAAKTSFNSLGFAWAPVEFPVTIKPSDRKSEAAEAVSLIETSEVIWWALCFFLISVKIEICSASMFFSVQ